MRSKFVMLAGACLALIAGPASADSLGQAIADAYRNNPQLEAQRAELRSIDENVIQASSPYRLRASVVGSIQYQEQDQRDLFFGDVVRNRNRGLGATLSASQILLNGGRTAAQVSIAEAIVLSGRERLREVENFLLLEVVDSYVSVRRDQDLIGIQRRSVESYTRQVEQARARERGGDLTRTDIAQAEAQLGIIRTQLAQSEANLERSRARFAAVVGRNPGQLDPEPQLPGVPPSINVAYRVAEAESPTLWQAILNERAGRARISAERAERNPILSLNAGIGLNSPNSVRFGDLERGASASANLTIPLLTGGVIASRVRQAIAGQQALAFTVEATRRGVDVQIQNAWNQSVSSREQFTIGVGAVEAANSALIGVRRGFEEGFRSNFEVLDSEQRLLNAQVIVANARYQVYQSQANLLAYLGRLQAAAIDQAVTVYDAEENLARQKRRQYDPVQLITEPLDKLSRAEDDSRPAPIIPAATDPTVRTATTPPPARPLGTALPVDPADPRPALPSPEAPPPASFVPVSQGSLAKPE
jgi:outer membrane protein